MTILLLLTSLAALLVSGVQNGRKVTLARHEDNRRTLRDAVTFHLCLTILAVLYGIFARTGWLWTVCMLLASAAGPLLGYWAIRRVTPEDLKAEQLRTEAILER